MLSYSEILCVFIFVVFFYKYFINNELHILLIEFIQLTLELQERMCRTEIQWALCLVFTHRKDRTMKIREEIRNDVAVLTISGNLMSGPEVAPFHDYIKRLMLDGISKVVLDFSKVKWFGSAMLGVMVAAMTSVKQVNGDIRLTGITEKIESILMVTKLASIFRALDSVDRAVASFETQPPVVVESATALVGSVQTGIRSLRRGDHTPVAIRL